VPIGALAHHNNDNEEIKLDGMVGNLDGSQVYRRSISGPADGAASLGVRLAERLIADGALELLEQSREEAAKVAESVI
jgi:hydroxymethylbilane synthase